MTFVIYLLVCVVNRYGVVRFEAVMKLREELELLGKMSGITQDEKGKSLVTNLAYIKERPGPGRYLMACEAL